MISFDAFECNSTIGYSAKQVYQSADSIYFACAYVIISAEHMFLIFKCPFNIAQIATVQWAKTYQILEEEEILFCTCVEKNYIVKVNSNITECTNDINKQFSFARSHLSFEVISIKFYNFIIKKASI